MTSRLRVLVELPTKGKRWVAVAADWPGLERGARTEDEAVEKVVRYVPRYLPVATRAGLGGELEAQTDADVIGRYQAEFDETAARVSADLRPGVRGGGRSRDRIIQHVTGQEGADFSKRVKVPAEYGDLPTAGELADQRDRFVEAMRAWYMEGKPLGSWTIPYLLRHAAYHVLDHTWEMQDRDLTNEATAGTS